MSDSITSISETEENEFKNLLSRSEVEDYIKYKGYTGLRDLLTEITQKGLSEFINYLNNNLVKGIHNTSDRGLLHGSRDLFSLFEPRVSTGGKGLNKQEPLVYATADPEYATFMSVIQLTNGWAGVNYTEGKISCYVGLDFINGGGNINSGYIYVLNKNGFEQQSRNEFTSPEEQEPILIIPTHPKDLEVPVVVLME
jgi:hypothetical protein